MKPQITRDLQRNMENDPSANTFGPRTGDKIQAVALSPVNDSYYHDFTLEPPMVRVRAGNDGLMYLSSSNRGEGPSGTPSNDAIIAAPGDGVLARKIKRMGVTFLSMNHGGASAINKTNNVLHIYVRTTSTVYTITLTPGWYNSPQLLYTEFIAAVNRNLALRAAVLFTPVFRGSANPNAPGDNWHVLLVASVPVYFLPQSTLMAKGRTTFNLAIVAGTRWDGFTTVLTATPLAAEYDSKCFTTQMSGTMHCVYSRWADFQSQTLTAFSKNPNTTSRTGAPSLIFRIIMPPFSDYPTDPGTIVITNTFASVVGTPIVYVPASHENVAVVGGNGNWTMNPDITISTVDIQVVDEYGSPWVVMDPLYFQVSGGVTTDVVPSIVNDSLSYQITIKTEI